MPKNPKKPDTRDPIAKDLRTPKYRKRVEKTETESKAQQDAWSKNAKHKKQSLDEFYHVGDKVEIINGPLKKVLKRADEINKKKNSEAIVKEPLGPDGSIGIMIDGEYHLVDEEDLKLLYEEFEKLAEWSYAETTSGINIPISSEEHVILKMCGSKSYKSHMDEREQELARRMVSRGVLNRHKDDKGLYFIANSKKTPRF